MILRSETPTGAIPLDAPRVARALAAGAFVGATLVSLAYGLAGGLRGRPVDMPSPGPLESFWLNLPIILVVAFPLAFLCWFLGLLFVGAPGWWVLHRLRLRGLGIALAFGFLATYLFGVSLSGGFNGPLWMTLLAPAPLAIVGVFVAAAVWFIAYRAAPAKAAA